MCKVKVNEFAIGFGPTLISKQKGETKYALHLIPLGGFVSLEGEEERSDTEGSFSNTSIPKKIAIVLAGGLVNIIFGLLVYFILISSTAKIASNEVDYTIDNYQAKIAGIESGDKIISIDGNKIKIRAREELAIAFQHEIDHLNGILFYDRIDPNHKFYNEYELRLI